MMTNLKRLREKAGMRQAALARKIGVSRQMVNSWESGKRNLSLELAVPVSKALGCSLDELVDQTEKENDNETR